jgi:hypothetical protein
MLDVSFIHKQGANWVVEGVALTKNPGSVRLDFKAFTYELHYALSSDDFGRQQTKDGVIKETPPEAIPFQPLFKRSWLEDYDYMYLEPGERSRHSFLAALPVDTTMVVLICEFTDSKGDIESVRKSYAVPQSPRNL